MGCNCPSPAHNSRRIPAWLHRHQYLVMVPCVAFPIPILLTAGQRTVAKQSRLPKAHEAVPWDSPPAPLSARILGTSYHRLGALILQPKALLSARSRYSFTCPCFVPSTLRLPSRCFGPSPAITWFHLGCVLTSRETQSARCPPTHCFGAISGGRGSPNCMLPGSKQKTLESLPKKINK